MSKRSQSKTRRAKYNKKTSMQTNFKNPLESLLSDYKLNSSISNTEPFGRLPAWSHTSYDVNIINRRNRYLKYQGKRVLKLLEEEKYNHIVLIWCLVLKNSTSYHLYLMNKTYRQWFWKLSETAARKLFQNISNRLRVWNMNILVERFYILKKSGKWRPIGCPNVESRVLTRAIGDLVYLLFQNERAGYQNGFIKNRGIHTAIGQIIYYYQKGWTRVYEFDFQSFFNMIIWRELEWKLSERSEMVSGLVMTVIENTKYIIRKLKSESELKPVMTMGYPNKRGNVKYYTLMERSGITQGINLAPLLSTLTIEGVPAPEGLVMFADDGVLMHEPGSKGLGKLTPWLNGIAFKGAVIAPEKSGIKMDSFRFLGIEIDLVEKTLNYEGKIHKWDKGIDNHQTQIYKAMEWVKSLNINYTNKKDWMWDGNGLSYLQRMGNSLGWTKWFFISITCWWTGGIHQGYKWINGIGLRHVPSGSTNCLIMLMNDLKVLKFKRRKPLTLKRLKGFEPGKRFFVKGIKRAK